MRVALYLAHWPPAWLPLAGAHLSSSRTVPWPLVLRLLASAELCCSGPASPTWSSQEPSDLSGLNQGDPLGLLQDVHWALSRIPQIPDYSRDSILAIMELDWFCTGVLKVRHPCSTRAFMNYPSLLEKQKGCHQYIICHTFNTRANRVVIVCSKDI